MIINFVRWGLVMALAALVSIGCGDSGEAAGTGGQGGANEGAVYAISTTIISPAGRSSFLSILRSLRPSPEELDLGNAYEFAGDGDMWVRNGDLYTTSGESPTVAKNRVSEAGELIEQDRLSFAAFGVPSTAFWANIFVDETKAYVANGVSELIAWDPQVMEITGTVDIPQPEIRDGLFPTFGSGDRGTVIHDGQVFQTLYWTDLSFARFDEASQIVVFDIETDSVVDLIDAPCPGLAYATADEQGNLYFSPWTGAAGSALVLGEERTCAVVVDAATHDVTSVLNFAELTEGREGGVMRYVGNGRFAMSIFHDEDVDLEAAIDDQDPFAILATASWRVWTYEAATGDVSVVDGIESNSGAIYWFDADGMRYALVPGEDYASSAVYELADGGETPTRLFDYPGWAVRLFRVR
ncbi:MAG: hypothetical protein AAF500_21675 [Myxococcota bacterium]